MRLIFALVFLVGIGIAGAAVYMAMERFKVYEAENARLRASAGGAIDLVPVAVAVADLRYGMPLERNHVIMVEYPSASVPKTVFNSIEDLFGEDGTPSRAVLRTMEKGEAILASKVTNFGQEAGVAARLERGMRAFTIQVDVTTGVSGFLQPGDRVDVYWTGRRGNQSVTQLLLEDIQLIAVDQIADIDTNRPVVARTVTVEVTPIVVATLAQARTSGRLSLSLRGIAEDEILGPLQVSQESILGIEEVVEEEVERCFVGERRGGALVQREVECTD